MEPQALNTYIQDTKLIKKQMTITKLSDDAKENNQPHSYTVVCIQEIFWTEAI